MHIDELVPGPDVDKRHSVFVPVTQDRAWEALRRLDLRESWLVRVLLALRGMRASSMRWSDLERFGFVPVIERAPSELALGMIAQPWRLRGGIRRTDVDGFLAFEEPGYAKIAWNYAIAPVPGGSRITTVTLVACTDAGARRRFLRYWRVVGPFSAVIRRRSLALVARRATSAQE